MQHRRGAYKSTFGPRRLTYDSAAKISRFMRNRLSRGGRYRRVPTYRRLAAGTGSSVPFRQYINAGLITRIVRMRKSLQTLNYTGSNTGYGGLSAFSLSGQAQGAYAGVTFQNNFATPAGTAGNTIAELASLQTLFELYKMANVRLRIRMRQSEFTDGVDTPKLYITTVSDLSPVNSTAPSGIAYFDSLERVTIHEFTNNSPFFEYSFKPRIQVPAYTTSSWIGSSVGYSAVAPRWLDLTHASNVQHYGVAYWFSNIPTGVSFDFDLEFTFDVKKNQ